MRLLLAALFVSLAFVAPAQAHHTGKGVSETIWFDHFNSWCGLGKPWCDNRKVQLSCRKSDRHLRDCVYVYREAKIDPFSALGIVTRECHMDGEMRHRTILYGARNCTGWS